MLISNVIANGRNTISTRLTIDTEQIRVLRIKEENIEPNCLCVKYARKKPVNQNRTTLTNSITLGLAIKFKLWILRKNKSPFVRSKKVMETMAQKKIEKDTQAMFSLLQYYTPKTLVFQAKKPIIRIFVNYADFYVNIIM